MLAFLGHCSLLLIAVCVAYRANKPIGFRSKTRCSAVEVRSDEHPEPLKLHSMNFLASQPCIDSCMVTICVPLVGADNLMYLLRLSTMEWQPCPLEVFGEARITSQWMGFASCNENLYIFGGWFAGGGE